MRDRILIFSILLMIPISSFESPLFLFDFCLFVNYFVENGFSIEERDSRQGAQDGTTNA